MDRRAGIARRPRFIRIRDIAFIRAAGNYTELHTASGPPLLVLRTLATWEAQFAGSPFVRVHRSVLVNLDFVERIERSVGYTYELYVRGHAAPLTMSRRRPSAEEPPRRTASLTARQPRLIAAATTSTCSRGRFP